MHEQEAQLATRIGAAVRQHRLLCGLSQEALAERVELSTHFIGLVERGKQLPSLTTLFAFARALGVGLHDLLEHPDASPVASSWEREALSVLASVPTDFRDAVVAMLRALGKVSRRTRVAKTTRRRR